MGDEELHGINVPKLEDEVQEYARTKEARLDDVVAPTLEDVYVPPPCPNRGELDDVVAPVLEDTYPAKEGSLGGLEEIVAPVLEDTYVEPEPKKEELNIDMDLEAVRAALLEEDDIERNTYKPNFVDTSAEEARKEALDRSIKGSLNEKPASFDEKKSREMYLALMEEQRIELAQKGGKRVIILMILGIVMSVLFYLFASANDLKPDRVGAVDRVTTVINYCCIASGIASLLMVARVKAAKGFASFTFGVMTAVSLIGGGYVLTEKNNFAVNLAMIAVVFILNVYISFTLNSSEAIDAYYKGKGA
ncbi:MAG: hypothetical protein GX365_01610 [Clostridiales bacterium]|nr:hypothetical protein [Clostridiales bacterium]